MILYTDNQIFEYNFWDYYEIHGHLLLRRQKTSFLYEGPEKPIKHNIDVFFYGVYGMNIKTRYNGLTIEIVKRTEGQISGCNLTAPKTVFMLSDSTGCISYLYAAGFKIFYNDFESVFPFTTSVLRDPEWSKSSKLIYSSEKEVKRFEQSQ